MVTKRNQLNFRALCQEYTDRETQYADKSLCVSLDEFIQRVKICYQCPKTTGSLENIFCIACDCKLDGKPRGILVLAIRVEELPKFGCKLKYRGRQQRGRINGWSRN